MPVSADAAHRTGRANSSAPVPEIVQPSVIVGAPEGNGRNMIPVLLQNAKHRLIPLGLSFQKFFRRFGQILPLVFKPEHRHIELGELKSQAERCIFLDRGADIIKSRIVQIPVCLQSMPWIGVP